VKKFAASFRRQWLAFRYWWHRRYRLIRNYFIVVGLLLAFLTVYFWPYLTDRVFMSLRPGEAGVLWERFFGGTNLNWTYREGFHLVMPWNRMYVYNVRLQQTPHKIVALCKNGLPVELEVSIRHRPLDGKLPLLHAVVGPDYVNVVIKPEIEAHVRAVVSQFEPAELYTSEGYILNLIVQGAQSEMAERYISLDDLLIKRIILPAKIAEAIESKLIQEQRLFEYTFLIGQAEQEAKRKAIEGAGILKFQQEVASGGSFKDYLRYAGIQATVDLARSNNAKMVMVGNSDGLPVILNMPDDSNRAGAAPNGNTGLPPRGTSAPSPLTLPRADPTAPRAILPETSAPPSSTPETSAPPVTVPANGNATGPSTPPHETAPTTPPPTGIPDSAPSNPGTKTGKP
jgi:regulator of protease activity HflC (stomatin/prohibitin superfamily)